MIVSANAAGRRLELNWAGEAAALFRKDLRAELRTRVAVNSIGLFAFSSLLLLALATRGLRDVLGVHLLRIPIQNITQAHVNNALFPAWSDSGKMGLLWTLLCFAAFTGLAHSFVHEEEAGTVTALRLSMSAQGAYAGKLAFNLAVLLCIAVIVTPLYVALTGMEVGSPVVFIAVMLGGCIGLASAATIVAALASKARGSGALFGAIGLPVVTVLLMLILNAANTLYNPNAPLVRVVQDVGGLLSFGVLLITVSAITFPIVWNE